MTPLDIKNYLGDVLMEDDKIVSAKATYMQWFGKINASDISEDDVSNMGTGEIVDEASLEWELALRLIHKTRKYTFYLNNLSLLTGMLYWMTSLHSQMVSRPSSMLLELSLILPERPLVETLS